MLVSRKDGGEGICHWAPLAVLAHSLGLVQRWQARRKWKDGKLRWWWSRSVERTVLMVEAEGAALLELEPRSFSSCCWAEQNLYERVKSEGTQLWLGSPLLVKGAWDISLGEGPCNIS
jgi:hypothetical protein